MRIGVPREIKPDEYRVGLLPVGAEVLTREKHEVLVERGAGAGSGFDDEQYEHAGARLVDSAAELYARAEMIVKVKEPQPIELPRLRQGQVLFTYFHFAADRELTCNCLKAGIGAVAYETLADPQGGLPLLKPMSEVAGKMSIQEGAKCLEKPQSGRGILLSGVTGVRPANVLVLGAGIVGSNAARTAAGLGANVTLLDINLDRLRYLSDVMPDNVTTIYSDPQALRDYLHSADLVIGAVLVPGGRAPQLIERAMLENMKTRAVIVDVSIDQGGCCETSRPTTHHEPTYIVDDVVHYCVTNIPGAVGRTSSQALCNATLRYARELARLGLDAFCKVDAGHAAGLNMRDGRLVNPAVEKAFPDLPRA
ncbi:MAG: alanine dehydrogenase [Planctomycetota bacterium]